jgi:hypothetical protein
VPLLTPAGTALARVICAGFARSGVVVEVAGVASRPWASVTFAGERHVLRLRLVGAEAGAAADAFLDGLSECEFELRGHLVADIALVSRQRGADGERLTLEALTVEGD